MTPTDKPTTVDALIDLLRTCTNCYISEAANVALRAAIEQYGREQGFESTAQRDVREAYYELRDALGNPVISGTGDQTLQGQTIRMAAAKLREASATRKPIEGDWRTGAINYLRAVADGRRIEHANVPHLLAHVDTIDRIVMELEIMQNASPYGLDCVPAPPFDPAAEPPWHRSDMGPAGRGSGEPVVRTLLEQHDLDQSADYRKDYEDGRIRGYEVGYKFAVKYAAPQSRER